MGLQLAEPDFHTRCFVEWEEYPRRVLINAQRAGYLQPAPIWDDVTTFDARPLAGSIDTLIAGYPCQPFSQAGQRRGEDDERHLWPDVARIAGELGSHLQFIFLENVSGHVTLGAEAVLRKLRSMGFTPAVGLFSAQEVGAPHERLRWFCMAYRKSADRWGEQQQGSTRGRWSRPSRGGTKLDNTTSSRCLPARLWAGSKLKGWERLFGKGCNELANTSGARAAPWGAEPHTGQQGLTAKPVNYSRSLFPPGPSDAAAWASILSVEADRAPATSFHDIACRAKELAQMVAAGELAEKEAEPDLRRMVDGLAQRSRALKLLGNGVHPLAAGHAARTLLTAHGFGPVGLGASNAA